MKVALEGSLKLYKHDGVIAGPLLILPDTPGGLRKRVVKILGHEILLALLGARVHGFLCHRQRLIPIPQAISCPYYPCKANYASATGGPDRGHPNNPCAVGDSASGAIP